LPEQYILGIDQSTSGTKALLFDGGGRLAARQDVPHRQLIDEKGWVEHDPLEIYRSTLAAVRGVVEKAGADKERILGVGVSNQRETALIWNRKTGLPVYNAVVWQCARGEAICRRLDLAGQAGRIKEVTGLHLSPYFSAAKLAWVLENVPGLEGQSLCCGTMDSWLLYKLCGEHKTDYSNASRTQLFDLRRLEWSREVCGLFGIDIATLPRVCDSNSLFGETDFEGYLNRPVPVHGVLGDSHGALFGQGCHSPGMMKVTYGTGSSVMMNTGGEPAFSDKGVVTSIGWGMDGRVEYVLEGNINYTGAVMKWVAELGLIESPKQAAELAAGANPADQVYLVPAFSGLNAPYWDSEARAILCGMTRNTGRAEIVKAAEECIAYQIADIVGVMSAESHIPTGSLRVDGGPTRDAYLMQFQSDILGIPVLVPEVEELSGMGPAYAAGIALGLYQKDEIFAGTGRREYSPQMDEAARTEKLAGWRHAVELTLSK